MKPPCTCTDCDCGEDGCAEDFRWRANAPGPMDFRRPVDAHREFFNALHIIAATYDCTITRIDTETWTVELEGPEDKQAECARKIAEALFPYLRE